MPFSRGSSARRKDGKEKTESARAKIKRSRSRVKYEEENDENMNTKKPPVIDNQGEVKEVENEEGGEGITSYEFTAKKNEESQFESLEDGNVRKRSRTKKLMIW